MAILKETERDTLVCDGCGRTDAGPNQPLHIEPYTVHDPNVGSGMPHHYCAGCAANRGLAEPVATIAGWVAAVPTPPGPEEQSEPTAEPA